METYHLEKRKIELKADKEYFIINNISYIFIGCRYNERQDFTVQNSRDLGEGHAFRIQTFLIIPICFIIKVRRCYIFVHLR